MVDISADQTECELNVSDFISFIARITLESSTSFVRGLSIVVVFAQYLEDGITAAMTKSYSKHFCALVSEHVHLYFKTKVFVLQNRRVPNSDVSSIVKSLLSIIDFLPTKYDEEGINKSLSSLFERSHWKLNSPLEESGDESESEETS